MKFIIDTIEQEQYRRRYIVNADTEEKAKEMVRDRVDSPNCIAQEDFDECFDFELDFESVEVLK